jgi:hypothetical protein
MWARVEEVLSRWKSATIGKGSDALVSYKHHAEDSRDDTAEDKRPFVACLLTKAYGRNNLEDALDDCPHHD